MPRPDRREQIFCLRTKPGFVDERIFNRLSLGERADLLWDKGVFVDSILINHYLLMLYSVNHRFFELSYDVKAAGIVWITHANEYDLEKYLVHINIAV